MCILKKSFKKYWKFLCEMHMAILAPKASKGQQKGGKTIGKVWCSGDMALNTSKK